MADIPTIDVSLPAGWYIEVSPKEWIATSPSEAMYISVTNCYGGYKTVLYKSTNNTLMMEIQSPDLAYVVPAIVRMANLATASE
jgi:hypothetical protein